MQPACTSILLVHPPCWSRNADSLPRPCCGVIPFTMKLGEEAASHDVHELAAVLLHRLGTSHHKEELALIWSITVLYSSKFFLQDTGIGNISCYLHCRYLALYSFGEKSADAEDLLAHFESYEWRLAGTPKKPWSLCPHAATLKKGLIHWIKWVYDDFFLFFKTISPAL